MNSMQAKKEGVAAFKAGKGRAPALNQTFLKAAAATGSLLSLMDDYMHGWTIAMLAEDAPLEDMPSVKTLKAIEEA